MHFFFLRSSIAPVVVVVISYDTNDVTHVRTGPAVTRARGFLCFLAARHRGAEARRECVPQLPTRNAVFWVLF